MRSGSAKTPSCGAPRPSSDAGFATEEDIERLTAEIRGEIEEAVEFGRGSP